MNFKVTTSGAQELQALHRPFGTDVPESFSCSVQVFA